MTVGQLIEKLKKLNPDMPVVVRAKSNGYVDDFKDLKLSDVVELNAKLVFSEPYWGEKLYDASEDIAGKKVKILSLSGGTFFQRSENEKER